MSDEEKAAHDEDQTVMLYQLPERIKELDSWSVRSDSYAAPSALVNDDLVTGLADIGFVKAALRRSLALWISLALAGLLIGAAIFVEFPPAYKGQTSLLLTMGPNENSQDAITDAQAIAQSRPVAQLALKILGLNENVSAFQSHLTVTNVTDKVLQIDYSAASSGDAVSGAAAVGTAFLRYQKTLLNTYLTLERTDFQQQEAQGQQAISSLNAQITQQQAKPASAARASAIAGLTSQRTAAQSNLEQLQSTASGTLSVTQSGTLAALSGSSVLDPATLVHTSFKKIVLLYVGGGLVAGLLIGLGLVIIRALVSGKLRRRYDVLRALGAPVRLSVGPVSTSRWRRRLSAAKDPKIRRITSHLASVLPQSPEGPAALAVVAVDEVTVPALAVAALAVSRAKKGLKVVLADLCEGAPAASLLGFHGTGVQAVEADGAHLVVSVPENDDIVPAGPMETSSLKEHVSEQLATACASADVLLTFVSLDPAVGSEHLAGWASAAAVVVTAGASSPERIFAVGELIRLAEVPVLSTVLIGADRDDQSLGVLPSPGLGSDIEVVTRPKGLFVAPAGAAIEE